MRYKAVRKHGYDGHERDVRDRARRSSRPPHVRAVGFTGFNCVAPEKLVAIEIIELDCAPA
jgi:hypothetical protein